MQYEAFIACCDELSKRGISLGIRHCCNSLATLNFPYMQLDMVRIGISLYGHITGETSSKLELKNAIELKSKVIAVKELCENDTVSYSRTFTAHQNIKTAVISIGYADGILRSYSNKMEVIIDNGTERFKAKIRGRICMDLCVAEVTGKECNVGDEVTIFGREICLYDYAKLGDTIVDEIVCALNKRIKRKYIYNGGI